MRLFGILQGLDVRVKNFEIQFTQSRSELNHQSFETFQFFSFTFILVVVSIRYTFMKFPFIKIHGTNEL